MAIIQLLTLRIVMQAVQLRGGESSDPFFTESRNPIKFLNELNGANFCFRTVAQLIKNPPPPLIGTEFRLLCSQEQISCLHPQPVEGGLHSQVTVF
jgi:hypothetical protein